MLWVITVGVHQADETNCGCSMGARCLVFSRAEAIVRWGV